MLNVRVIAPREVCDAARELADADPTVANVVEMSGTGRSDGLVVLLFDVARENANEVVHRLRKLDIEHSGSITLAEPLTTLSTAAAHAQANAPGHPDDALVWDEIEDEAENNAQWSWSFAAFLLLAALIASAGRYLDQPILIVGAMVVGPEFAPIAALCIGVVHRRPEVSLRAAVTVALGFLTAGTVTWLLWFGGNLAGWVDVGRATTGPQTGFVIAPNVWSFLIALLAGCAGVLSLTTEKSSALVGVFISVTTVPALGAIGLTIAVGDWDEATSSAVQLGVNVAGLIVAGIVTLAVQAAAWQLFGKRRR